MKTVLVVFGVLAAVLVGAVALFTMGEVVALVVFAALLVVAVGGRFAPPAVVGTLAAAAVMVVVAAGAFIGWQATQIAGALTDTSGPVDPPDPVDLASARAKIDEVEGEAGFRLELLDREITAYILDALEGNQDNPLERVDIDIVGTPPDGEVTFDATFKSGDITASGAATAGLEAGAVKIELVDVEVGALSMPGVGRDALEDLVESVADLNEALAESRADVQSITVGNDRLVVVGTTGTTNLITSETLLSTLADQVATAGTAMAPPPERLGPGIVKSTSADGSTYYVALGDSLAANVGVTEPRNGYVSRFHRAISERDGLAYGLRNFAVSGETSGSLIRSGQLEEALAFMAANPISYVTIDIGGNDLLGHLSSGDCSEDPRLASCRQRVADTFNTYEDNLQRILTDLADAAPDATIIFLTTYNPFSLGFGGDLEFEAESNRITSELNAIAERIATEKGVLVADGFTPMQGTTASTTHMVNSPPDIHPLPIGFDILAAALLDTLG